MAVRAACRPTPKALAALAARALAATLLLVPGCGGEGAAPHPDARDAGAPAPAAAPRRLVVMAPAAAEMIHALGEAHRVVGVGDFVHWPPELARRPRVGAYDTPNQEVVLELRADLLVTSTSREAAPGLARLRRLGVEVLELDTSTFEGVFDALGRLGEVLDRDAEARRLATAMEGRLEEVRRRAADAPRRRVLAVVGRDPLYVAGPGSHLDELIRLAGGANVAHDARAPYQLLSMEAVLERRPEVIVDTSDNRPGALRGRRPGPWGQWPFLPAVEADRVYWVDPGRLSVPGIRLPEMALLLGRLIHPEVFGEVAAREMEPLAAESPDER